MNIQYSQKLFFVISWFLCDKLNSKRSGIFRTGECLGNTFTTFSNGRYCVLHKNSHTFMRKCTLTLMKITYVPCFHQVQQYLTVLKMRHFYSLGSFLFFQPFCHALRPCLQIYKAIIPSTYAERNSRFRQ